MAKNKAMEESGGTAGGYTAGNGGMGDNDHMVEMVKSIAEHHAEQDADEGHEYHVHHAKKLVHHMHPADYGDHKHLAIIKGDLANPEVGAESVSQGPEGSPEEGFVKVFPTDGESQGGLGLEEGDEDEGNEMPMVEKGKCGKCAAMTDMRNVVKMIQPSRLRSQVAALHRTATKTMRTEVATGIPDLVKKGFTRDQAAFVMYTKAAAPDLEGDITGTPGVDRGGAGAVQPDESAQPPVKQGAAMLQQIAEIIEANMPTMEETAAKALAEELLDEISAFVKIHYPDVNIAGSDKEEKETKPDGEGGFTPDKSKQDTTKNPLERYKTTSPKLTKRYARKGHLQTIMDAAEHCKDMSEMEVGEPMERMHKAACAMHHKSLINVHKELSGGKVPEEEEEPKSEATPEKKKPKETGGELAEPTPDEVGEIVEKAMQPFKEAMFQITGRRPVSA